MKYPNDGVCTSAVVLGHTTCRIMRENTLTLLMKKNVIIPAAAVRLADELLLRYKVPVRCSGVIAAIRFRGVS
ncbi:MAG: hypothetical protein LBD93_04900 [Treponema sp.]|nr:hypothetical protein [Treponema sp.]